MLNVNRRNVGLVLSATRAADKNPPASTGSNNIDETVLGAHRMQILHESATVGGATLSSHDDPFVEDSLRVVSPEVDQSTATQPHDAPTIKRRKHLQYLAKSTINESTGFNKLPLPLPQTETAKCFHHMFQCFVISNSMKLDRSNASLCWSPR